MRLLAALVLMTFITGQAAASCPCWGKPKPKPTVAAPSTAPPAKASPAKSHRPAKPCCPDTVRVIHYVPQPASEHHDHAGLWAIGFAIVAGSVILASNHDHHDTVVVPAAPQKGCR